MSPNILIEMGATAIPTSQQDSVVNNSRSGTTMRTLHNTDTFDITIDNEPQQPLFTLQLLPAVSVTPQSKSHAVVAYTALPA